MPTRTLTPDTINPDGSRTLHLKRCCNGCGTVLGDVASHDVDARGNLTDVRSECANCRPLVALEAAGCRTWQLTRRSISEVSFARWRRYAAPAWGTDAEGKRVLDGLEFTAGPGHDPVTVWWGDWIVRHRDGHFTVHRGPAAAVGPDAVVVA